MIGRLQKRLTQLLLVFAVTTGVLLVLIYFHYAAQFPRESGVIRHILLVEYVYLVAMFSIIALLLLRSYEKRRDAQLESERQRRRLQDEVAAHERTNQELQRAKEVAEAANELKSRYVVGISHEIRSPLNAIYGYAQLLERNSPVDPVDAVRVIRRSSEHLSDLVDGLLDISRMEGGVMRISRDTIRLPDFLQQIVDMFRLQAEANGLNFIYDQPEYLPAYVNADQKRLRQVLINLLSNAIKFTRHGEVRLTVRYRTQIAHFEIEDTGIGIDEEDRNRIFEPFERGNQEAARMAPGTGLGLTITKLLVETMGGELTLHSEVGKGSRFRVKLMLSSMLSSDTEEDVRREILGYRGRRRSVLLVDDNPSHIGLMRGTLEPLGFDVVWTSDSAMVNLLAAQYRPDLVLLDVALGGPTGWDVADGLRAMDIPDLKIMMVSGNAHEYAIGGAPGMPHDAFVIKPFDVDVLVDQVGLLLGLDWTYAEEIDGVVNTSVNETITLSGSSRRYLDELYQLGRIGHVRAIEGKLKEMVAADPESEAFVSRLGDLIANFDLKTYMNMLDEVRDDH